MNDWTPARLLFVSPIVPAVTGNGLAMRAGATLRALARRHRVTLLVVPRYPSPAGLAADLRGCCTDVAVVPARAWSAAPSPRAGRSWKTLFAPAGAVRQPRFRGEPFDVVHVFRLAAWPFARPWLDASPMPQRWLDLDEVESVTHARLAALWRERGRPERAEAEGVRATMAAAQEADALATFERVFVCSAQDRTLLIGQGDAAIHVLPNALPVPEPLPPPPPLPPSGGSLRLLFVGSLGYPPNEAAAILLCREIVPALRRRSGRAATATIVGGGASAELERTAAAAGCSLTGYVADVAPHYRDAQLVVMPIQAGGGTRIKAIEAFAYRRPVVSTALGVEGLDVVDGTHILLGEDADAIARQCWRVMSEPALATRLVERAWDLFVNAYSADRLAAIVAAVGSEPAPAWPPC